MVIELWELPVWYGKVLLAFIGPLVLGLGSLLLGWLRWLSRRAIRLLRERDLEQRVAPILSALPYLRRVAAAERTELAEHLKARHVAAGLAVVRQGGPGRRLLLSL